MPPIPTLPTAVGDDGHAERPGEERRAQVRLLHLEHLVLPVDARLDLVAVRNKLHDLLLELADGPPEGLGGQRWQSPAQPLP